MFMFNSRFLKNTHTNKKYYEWERAEAIQRKFLLRIIVRIKFSLNLMLTVV